ncbi:phospholipid/cholesterol/gamma-HCH transport system permease protein [Albimonas donghaensis]|uniref:Phospholipid/cholesterol/gamma-HCH transport system permease protein n=1 Tax=Albimonas donghaensis TaxID=356660 RepID=A0A1H3ATZ2_9RHOB|nr:MlaE family lipid ABC transporter permease subunit [Albimonas donghaensis]SDX33085.1 phospholipid/cholesterol/gamma-HCH transport system permease protein [Albimonas donghaensis]
MSGAQTDLTLEDTRDGAVLRFAGRLVVAGLAPLERAAAAVKARPGPIALDLSRVEALDTAGAWLLITLRDRLTAEGAQVTIEGTGPAEASLIETVEKALAKIEPAPPAPSGFLNWVAGVGEGVAGAWASFLDLLAFLGVTLARTAGLLVRPWRMRAAPLVHHMQEVGFNAFPIVFLMSFLIGIVLGFQGASQLQQFGAEVFVVTLIAVSLLRELGILLTAIIVAGRSGSAFAASIGSMKIREEIDAMRTLGLDPIEVLVVPRTLALLIMLPVLGFIANMAGLLGGGLMAWIELGVSPGMFVTRLYDTTGVWQLAIGMIKAPFFAIIIAVVGCWQGMLVGGSAESVGQRTTAAVVMAIFAVIIIDAVFSIFFSEMGL